jgi:hypothetical protein
MKLLFLVVLLLALEDCQGSGRFDATQTGPFTVSKGATLSDGWSAIRGVAFKGTTTTCAGMDDRRFAATTASAAVPRPASLTRSAPPIVPESATADRLSIISFGVVARSIQ